MSQHASLQPDSPDIAALRRRVDVAAGRAPADLVLRGGRVVNLLSNEIIDADVAICDGWIAAVGHYDEGRQIERVDGLFICPGLIDAHVHVESSMLAVPEFARVVAAHGTTAVMTDPHEIANVHGLDGIRYMLTTGAGAVIDVFVLLSSCVPASQFESSGASLSAEDLHALADHPGVLGLAEMMNYPGVVAGDAGCLAKIAAARGIVDGHAPGLSGRDLCAYVASGIRSDHECTTIDEAREKLRLGLSIMIREGSQAKNLTALLPLITPATAHRFMFCTDDKDVDDLCAEGQIDHMVRRAIAAGLDPITALRVGASSAAAYFGLHDLGCVAPGRRAHIAVVDDLTAFHVRRTYHDGALVAVDGVCVMEPAPPARASLPASVRLAPLDASSFHVPANGQRPVTVHVIEVLEDRIDTERTTEALTPRDGGLHADPARDIVKLAVIERHRGSGRIGLGFARGFALARGAIASTVGHDAHNLIVAGVDDRDMRTAAAHLARIGGGLCAVLDGAVLAEVPLPIAGLMSDAPATALREQLREIHAATRDLGVALRRPFMALSFLCLSVIGKLKLTDQGLIDVDQFRVIPLQSE